MIGFLPLDDRPCNTIFPDYLARIAGEKLQLIDTSQLLDSRLRKNDMGRGYDIESDALILSIDRLVFRGLVESRKSNLTASKARARMNALRECLKNTGSCVYAFTTLMRQAPSAFSPEEQRIAEAVQQAAMQSEEKKKSQTYLKTIPRRIWRDYLMTRKRNLGINRQAIHFARQGLFHFVAVALDDLTSKGINQKEKRLLESMIKDQKLKGHAAVLPGADEMGVLLLAKALLEQTRMRPKIFPIYSHPDPDRFKLRYEDIRFSRIMQLQLKLLGISLAKRASDADLLLFIHSPHEDQLDVPLHPTAVETRKWLQQVKRSVEKGIPCILADVRYANGADANMMRQAAESIDVSRLAAYSAWNTTANALGIALAHGVIRWISRKGLPAQEAAQKQFLLLRFLEDWLYQAEIRPELSARLTRQGHSALRLPASIIPALQKELKEKLNRLSDLFLKSHFHGMRIINVQFPWNRLFDVCIKCK